MTVSARSDLAWVSQCSALEKKTFAKHEAMDIAAEVHGRGVTLLCAAPDSAPTMCAGFLVAQRSSLALSVTKLVVAPAWRRRGVGSALLAHAAQLGRHGRAQLATLHVDENNAAAKALYLSMGFVVSGRRSDYYRPGRSALAMELDLTAA